MLHLPPVVQRLARAVPCHTTPDIIFLPNLEHHRLHTCHLPECELTDNEKHVICIEVGHTCDRRLPTVVSDELSQHRVWMDYLTSQGWTVTLYPVVITHSGLIISTGPNRVRCTSQRSRHHPAENCKPHPLLQSQIPHSQTHS